MPEAERRNLEQLKRGRRVAVRLAERAAIVLLADDGSENQQIAAELGISRHKAGVDRLTVGHAGAGALLVDDGGTLALEELDAVAGTTVDFQRGTIGLAGGDRVVGDDATIATLFGEGPVIGPGQTLDIAGMQTFIRADTTIAGGALHVRNATIDNQAPEPTTVRVADVAPFVQALTDPLAYLDEHGVDPMLVGDINGDGALDVADVAPFVDLLVAAGATVPEPGSMVMLSAGMVILLSRRGRRRACAGGTLIAAAVLSATAPAAMAQSYWLAEDGDWVEADNWSDGVPGAWHDVVIDQGTARIHAVPVTVRQLDVRGPASQRAAATPAHRGRRHACNALDLHRRNRRHAWPGHRHR